MTHPYILAKTHTFVHKRRDILCPPIRLRCNDTISIQNTGECHYIHKTIPRRIKDIGEMRCLWQQIHLFVVID